jgi:hypothetical protein
LLRPCAEAQATGPIFIDQ